MRVATDNRLLAVDPGATAAVVVDVINTGEVIDGISAHIIGMSEQFVTTQPAMLPLFPEAMGQLTLSVNVPATHPAGRHALTVEVVSHGAHLPSQFLDVDMDVAARPALRMVAAPRSVRARRQGRFVLELTNEGNIPLEISLSAGDADRAANTVFSPDVVRVEAGAVTPVMLTVRGPRMFTGAEIDRTVTVKAEARRVEALLDPGGAEIELERETIVRLRQRPLIGRGLLTALILISIVALWAGVFLLGLTKVFSGDALTKDAPASFFAAYTPPHSGASTSPSGGAGSGSPGASGSGTGGSTGTGGSGAAGGGGSGAAPAGALPKTGEVPPGVGGSITGTVTAISNKTPVGRIEVQAWRMGRTALLKVGSAATQSDGTYSIAGLFPTGYYIEFFAPGAFKPIWYPNSPTQAKATAVNAVAQTTTPDINVRIGGLPASMSGTVVSSDPTVHVKTTVTAQPLASTTATGAVVPVVTATTDSAGRYTLPHLVAPESYQLTFVTTGYANTTLVDTVNGGETRLEPTVTLGANTGQISGVVLGGTIPLGGATVSTSVNGQALSVMTPTTGQVGSFTLDNLATPGTYVISATAPGYGSFTKVISLTAGHNVSGLQLQLANGTGTVFGQLVDSSGNGLGGATVTVGGATGITAPTTTTLTSPSGTGDFTINGLASPGSYTITFTLTGYAPVTIPVTLGSNSALSSRKVTMQSNVGSIEGTVTATQNGSTGSYIGATVTATNGVMSWRATSSAAGGALKNGGYLISGLAPGTYSVTVTAPNLSQQTGQVTVVASSKPTILNLNLGG